MSAESLVSAWRALRGARAIVRSETDRRKDVLVGPRLRAGTEARGGGRRGAADRRRASDHHDGHGSAGGRQVLSFNVWMH